MPRASVFHSSGEALSPYWQLSITTLACCVPISSASTPRFWAMAVASWKQDGSSCPSMIWWSVLYSSRATPLTLARKSALYSASVPASERTAASILSNNQTRPAVVLGSMGMAKVDPAASEQIITKRGPAAGGPGGGGGGGGAAARGGPAGRAGAAAWY